MGYRNPGYYLGPKPVGRIYALLGFLAALGILYLAFYLSPTQYPLYQAALIGLGAAFAGGFISRMGKRGATIGFLLLFLPLLFFGILLFLPALLAPVADVVPGLPSVFEGLALEIGQGVGASLWLALIIVGLIGGIIGLIVGWVGGRISGKLFPLEPRPEDSAS